MSIRDLPVAGLLRPVLPPLPFTGLLSALGFQGSFVPRLSNRCVPAYACAACRPGNTGAFSVLHKFMFAAQPGHSPGSTLAADSTSGQAPARTSSSDGGSAVACTNGSSVFSSLPPVLRVCGLTVSSTDEQIAVATAAGRVMQLNITAAVEAREEAAVIRGNVGASSADAEPAAGALGAEAVAADVVDTHPVEPGAEERQVRLQPSAAMKCCIVSLHA